MPSGLNGLPAPKGLAVESESNGLALRSPRSSAWTERGSEQLNQASKADKLRQYGRHSSC